MTRRMARGPLAAGYTRLQKLCTMSAGELTTRAAYGVWTAWERARLRDPHVDHLHRLERAIAASRRQTPAWVEWLHARRRDRRAAFLGGVERRVEMQELFRTHYASALEATRSAAALTRDHRFEFFGGRFEYGRDIDWHADPESGRPWPRVYHRDVPIHDGVEASGDVKYVWELSRQQYLTDLGKLAYLESNAADAAAASALVAGWIAANPVGIGVNWACALEPAFRVLSWLWTYHLCLESPGLDDDRHLVWLSGFHDHGAFLYRHLEHYASPYNHLIGEAAALYALGVLFPEFRSAAAWRRRGRQVLESRLGNQFYDDGGSVEQSTFYHHATLGFYLFAALVGRANHDELGEPVWRAIERGVEFSMHLTQPDGRTPPIGGADDGKPIRLEHRPLWDFRAFQAAGAVLFSRGDMKYVAGDFSEDALWLLGPDGRTRFDALPSGPPSSTACGLGASGYYVARSAWTRGASYLCFDCGEQADGVRRDGVPNAVHGHADCLSAIVWLGGRPVIVDPGVYRYNGDPAWVGHFRRTGAHNTLAVDGADQARYHGKMAWSNAFRPRLELWDVRANQALVMGSHDGYARQRDATVHRRAAWLRPDDYVIFLDEVTGEGHHALTLRWQFAEGEAELTGQGGLLFDGFAETTWVASIETSAELRRGGSGPEDGWIAAGLGVRRAAPVLTVAASFEAPSVAFLTVLADRRRSGGTTRTATVRNGRRGLAIAVNNRHSTDWIVSGDMRPQLPFHTSARLGVWRIADGRVIESTCLGGGSQEPVEGQCLAGGRDLDVAAGWLEPAHGPGR